MWERVIVFLIVGVTIVMTFRSLVRNLRGRNGPGCAGNCSGCRRSEIDTDRDADVSPVGCHGDRDDNRRAVQDD